MRPRQHDTCGPAFANLAMFLFFLLPFVTFRIFGKQNFKTVVQRILCSTRLCWEGRHLLSILQVLPLSSNGCAFFFLFPAARPTLSSSLLVRSAAVERFEELSQRASRCVCSKIGCFANLPWETRAKRCRGRFWPLVLPL